MAVDITTIVEMVVITQFLTPTAKSFGEVSLGRGKYLVGKLLGMLTTINRKPQPVEEKTLFTLVQAAALESDETLAGKWAALLANAADTAQHALVQPWFIDILRQLTPLDAQVVQTLYTAAEQSSGTERAHSVHSDGIISILGIAEQEARLSLDNLLRLQLCKAALTYGGYTAESFARPTILLMTTLRLSFVRAVTPPRP